MACPRTACFAERRRGSDFFCSSTVRRPGNGGLKGTSKGPAYRLAFLMGLCPALLINAQPVPKITSVSPEWVQRGTTAIVALEGENLADATGFLFSGDPGLAATN